MNCSNVPIEIKNAFDELKSLAVKYGVRTKRGSKQAFCKKIWGRIEDYLRLAVQSGEVSPRDVKDIRGLESVTEASSMNKGCIARDCTQNRMAEVLDLVHHGYVKYSNNEGTNPVLRCTNQVQKGGVPPTSTNPPPKDAHVPPTKPTEEKLATNLLSATSQAPQKSAFPSAASSSSATMTNNNNDDTLKPPTQPTLKPMGWPDKSSSGGPTPSAVPTCDVVEQATVSIPGACQTQIQVKKQTCSHE